MAVSITVSGKNSTGNRFQVFGTFTSAAGDTTLSLTPAVHGLHHVSDWDVALNAYDAATPNITNTLGTLTASWIDTKGASGTWSVIGK